MAASSTSGQGRPKGVPNKSTAEIKALAQAHGPAIIARLAHLAVHAESEATQVAAMREILDRGYGKSAQPQTGEGGEGNPVIEVTYRWGDGSTD